MSGLTTEAAERLFHEHRDGVHFTSISDAFNITSLPRAYDVQDELVPMLIEKHGQPCGYKIGLTSKPMQEMCGINQPIAGVVLADRVLESGASVGLAGFGRAGIEFEIAVRLGSDLGTSENVTSLDDVAAAVDAVCAAFEIVDDRNADYSDLDVLSLVADNSLNAGVVLSTFVAPPDDLAAVIGTVMQNGAEVASGPGSAALGHPYEPVRWLADHLVAREQRLREGDIVLTGSLVKTMFPAAGDEFAFQITGIGDVAVSFSD